MRTDEQILHDRINLPRLMKCLEQSIQEGDWSKSHPPKRETWIKAQAMLQQIIYARNLLKRVELDNVDPTPAQERRYQHFGTTLKHLEDYMRQVEHRSTPPVRKPKPILPSIPPPAPKSPVESTSPPVEATLIPVESTSAPSVRDLLPASPNILEPTRDPGPSHSMSSVPAGTGSSPAAPSSSKITATPIILQNSRALHEELSEQLASMATQLRKNATYFSESLERDKSVIVVMQEKVEGNFGFIKRERIRLRDFRGKSGGTTCLVIMSVAIVLIAFIFMVFIIRLT